MLDVIVSLTHNRRILRVVCAYALFTVNEYSVWIAVLVYAYEKGGATEAGIIAVIQLVPAGLCAPFMAVRADRSAPTMLLLAGFGLRSSASRWPRPRSSRVGRRLRVRRGDRRGHRDHGDSAGAGGVAAHAGPDAR